MLDSPHDFILRYAGGTLKRIEIDTARGKKRVPPGQYLVGDRFPILTYGLTPKFNADIWTFKVSGLVENPLQFTWEEWNELPKVEVRADMHCVTFWSKLDNVWIGVRAKTLLEMARPKLKAKFFSAFGGALRRGRPLCDTPQWRAPGTGTRLSSAANSSTPVRLEEREVDPRHRVSRL